MSPEDNTATLVAAESLEAAMRELSVDLKDLRSYGRRNRLLIVVVGSVVAMLIALGAVTWHAVDRANGAAREAKRASSAAAQTQLAQRTSCEYGNQFRADSAELWDFLIKLNLDNPDPSASKAEQRTEAKLIRGFQAKVAETYAARDCSKLAPTNPAK